MMRLYDSEVSGNAYKVRLLCSFLELPYEHRPVELGRTWTHPSLEGRTAEAKVPAIETDDGLLLAESDAILWYLARGTPWLPEDPVVQAHVLQWMFFEQNQHEPHVAVARALVHFMEPSEERERRLAFHRNKGRAALATMERWLADHEWFVGASPTIADIALYAYTSVAEEGGFDMTLYPHIARWVEAVRGLPRHIGYNEHPKGVVAGALA